MTQLNDIRKAFFEEGLNISQISRTYGFDRKTIRYYIKKDDSNKDINSPKLTGCFPKLNPFKPDIDSWLEEDKKASYGKMITVSLAIIKTNRRRS